MLRAIIFTVAMGLGSSLMADEVKLPTCKINNLVDAKKCMTKVAYKLPEYEEPNDGMASNDKLPVMRMLKAIEASPKDLKIAEEADFVGAVLLHGDEHQIVYFAMKKGTLRPVEIYDLNTVDIESMLVEKVSADDFFLGLDGRDYDVYEDVAYALKEFENRN